MRVQLPSHFSNPQPKVWPKKKKWVFAQKHGFPMVFKGFPWISKGFPWFLEDFLQISQIKGFIEKTMKIKGKSWKTFVFSMKNLVFAQNPNFFFFFLARLLARDLASSLLAQLWHPLKNLRDILWKSFGDLREIP